MVDLATVKQHLRVDETDDDAAIEIYIKAAKAYCEKYTGRAMEARAETYKFKRFDDCLPIPLSPVASVTTILYQDEEGDAQTLEAEDFRLVGSTIYPALGKTFPAIAHPSEIAVTVELGDGDDAEEDEIPEELTQAQLLLISHYYENREGVIVGTISSIAPLAVKSLLDLHRIELA